MFFVKLGCCIFIVIILFVFNLFLYICLREVVVIGFGVNFV